MMFEETNGTLLCSDLFHQRGVVEPMTSSDVIERARQTLVDYQAGPLANYMPYTKNTHGILQGLAALKSRTIAPMHDSAYVGDGEQAIRDFAVMMREVLG